MKEICKALGLKEGASTDEILAAITALQQAATKPGKALPAGITEEAIFGKMKLGLKREQAIAVIQSQQAEDAAEEKRKAKAAK